MAKHPINCAWCNRLTYLESGAINRARSANRPLYCGRECFGLSRRNEETRNKPEAQKKAEKAAYDREYKNLNAEWLKERRREYFKATYDPAKAAAERKPKMAKHVEYCRQPEYRVKKSAYDLKRRAGEFGEFADAYMLLSDIEREISERASKYEIYSANGTLNKALQRRKDYGKAFSS